MTMMTHLGVDDSHGEDYHESGRDSDHVTMTMVPTTMVMIMLLLMMVVMVMMLIKIEHDAAAAHDDANGSGCDEDGDDESVPACLGTTMSSFLLCARSCYFQKNRVFHNFSSYCSKNAKGKDTTRALI